MLAREHEVRGQLVGVGALYFCGSWGLNSGWQACWQASSATQTRPFISSTLLWVSEELLPSHPGKAADRCF